MGQRVLLMKVVMLAAMLQVAVAEVGLAEVLTGEIANNNYWSPACPAQFHKSWSAQNIASVCFHVSSSRLDWWQARTQCRTLASYRSGCHGDLASVLNYSENDFVRTLMGHLDVSDHAWIGYNDQTWEGTFLWSDSRQSSWSNFYYGEPNNGGGYDEDCVELMNMLGGKWNDRACSHQKHYVCKAYCV